MKNIFLINAHWNNRGDEAAVCAVLDELVIRSDVNISVQIKAIDVQQFNYHDNVRLVPIFPRLHDLPELLLGTISKGKFVWSKNGKNFFNNLMNADIVVHAPGGPSIGDIYSISEITYLATYLSIIYFKKKIFFYAPSMGPFNKKIRNPIRRKILKYADVIVLREEISKLYLDKLIPNNKAVVTLDAAFQSKIDKEANERKLLKYVELKNFIDSDIKIIGMTITDLSWHPIYSKNEDLVKRITLEIRKIIDLLIEKGYRVLLIPQLFGEANDSLFMNKFSNEDCMVMSDEYDAYFQQYIIGKMHALIGMRYHSNIFSAKMGVPFISISYEQKMKGFIENINYGKYCIDIETFSANEVIEKFNDLIKNYDEVKKVLMLKQTELYKKSHKTTEMLFKLLEN